MGPMWLAAGTALWLGILTSISPCPLATNVAAISFLGRRVDSPGHVFGGGLLYTAGVFFYLVERLPFHYTIWHVFVLTASGVFYAAVTLPGPGPAPHAGRGPRRPG